MDCFVGTCFGFTELQVSPHWKQVVLGSAADIGVIFSRHGLIQYPTAGKMPPLLSIAKEGLRKMFQATLYHILSVLKHVAAVRCLQILH